MGVKRRTRLRKGRLLLAMFLIVGVLFVADAVRRALFVNMNIGDDNLVVDNGVVMTYHVGKVAEEEKEEETPTPEVLGYYELDISSSQLASGTLVHVDYEHPYASLEMMPTVDLVYYRNDYYTLINDTDSVILNADAAKELNLMMTDYYNATGRANFLVYGTTDTYTGDGSYCPKYFPESSTANTVDLAVNVGSTVFTYDGCDDEKWIIDNCYKYGYIVRFPEGKAQKTGNVFCPWHLRYVGRIHSEIMHDMGMCLEEYIEFLSNYTFENPYAYNLDNTVYNIYSVKSTGETTSARVPVSSNYIVSGDNIDRFIITAYKC
ncbi:MAG: D-alanyl-D-alanine carboxypeptidase family protein [Ruminococcus sp.]|nr:D-alanyl-D-alanine carboxypeptidase family protein [Ruminococcus sp.]